MGELVYIDVLAKKREANVHDAWDRFVAAKAKADRTLKVEDGIASGKAYRDFLELFVRKS